jgi:hypothetical protein
MIFQRHNFKHNFLNAVETDGDLALEVVVNEINELVLDYPKRVVEALQKSGVRVPNKPVAKDLAVLINEQLTTNQTLRNELSNLILTRHQDPYINADGGKYDKMFVDSKDPDKTRISTGISKTFGVVENNHDTKIDVPSTEKVMLENLDIKMSQRGMSTTSSTTKIVVGCIVAALLIGGIIYLCRPKKQAV